MVQPTAGLRNCTTRSGGAATPPGRVQTALARAALVWHRLGAASDAYVRKILVDESQ
ncbi:hypothetical protein ACQEVZ_05485 [Dactylosporangium sp. CA-152071]|uniref:hypothetical protein n=1 Tax=Dactylosporangium sp. CA-152071 TaxID=3239933 RepID=UPI003D8A8B4E